MRRHPEGLAERPQLDREVRRPAWRRTWPRRAASPSHVAGAAAFLFAAVSATACSAAPNSASPSIRPAGPATVEVSGFQFLPQTLEVQAGTKVRYVNRDRAAHTVTHGRDGQALSNPAFDLAQGKGQTVEVEFSHAGVFPVTCKLHPTMNQTVTVTP